MDPKIKALKRRGLLITFHSHEWCGTCLVEVQAGVLFVWTGGLLVLRRNFQGLVLLFYGL